jgi:copper chaperone CopZ
MKTTKINITGMHCKSCETLITDVLTEIDGVESADVSEKKGMAIITHKDNVTEKNIREAIEAEGYKTL